VVSLAASFGRGAMTNHWIDLKNSDVIMIMGANPAENHPVGFRWALKAREKKNAKIVVIDPRLTRTAAVADIFIPLRSGTDIAFLGWLINYTVSNNLYFKEYVVNYTNAPFLVKDNYGFKDGLFSGYLEEEHKYNTESWGFQLDTKGNVLKDISLENPQSVFQIVKKHYSRYTAETVSKITGVSEEKLIEAAHVICSTGNPNTVGTVMYAVGWTQHTVGSQNIRAASMLQLLLGNIGRPGGGINALRGHANVQGQTDHGLVATTLPGYLKMPAKTQIDLKTYLKENTL
jgi:formate dehydrogenase (quinone-dependent) catalytic subunit